MVDIGAKCRNIGCDSMKYNFNKMSVSEGIEFCSIKADGFKSACVSVSFVLPLGEKASRYALVPNVLVRSSAKYPDLASIERKLANLYGADICVDVSKIGENHVLKMSVSCIDDRFALDNESLCDSATELLTQLVFEPKIEDNAFCSDDVAREKRKAIEHILGDLAQKRVYAKKRLIEEMYKGEAYGVPKCGTVEDVEKITGESLYAAWQKLLSTAFLRAFANSGCVFTLGVKYLQPSS
jgi:hypothetical protein